VRVIRTRLARVVTVTVSDTAVEAWNVTARETVVIVTVAVVTVLPLRVTPRRVPAVVTVSVSETVGRLHVVLVTPVTAQTE
jgi:hypothetical protein